MSHVIQLTHIVFATKNRAMTIDEAHCEDLYRFITRLVQRKKCELKRINGTSNHVHILLNLHPQKTLSSLVGEIKHDTSVWMKESGLFPHFIGWCREYYACSISPMVRDSVIEYIKNQKVHHSKVMMEDEFGALMRSAQLDSQGFMLE